MGLRVLGSGDTGLRLPWPKNRLVKVEGYHVYTLKSWKEKTDAPDFDPGDPTRNVVATDAEYDVAWVVEAAETSPGEETYHERVRDVDGRLVSETRKGTFYELDPATGEIVDAWDTDEFVIGGERIEFGGDVRSVRHDGETVFLVTTEHMWGYTDEGELIWKRSICEDWRTIGEGGPGGIRARRGGAGPDWDLEIDIETGEIIEHIDPWDLPDTFGDVQRFD